MPYDEPDVTDPMMGVGVVLPGGEEATRDMAYVFAEEFARLGHSEEKILRLFQTPFYRAAHGAYSALGEAVILRIVRECVGVWGRVRFVDLDAEREAEGLIQVEPCRTE